MIKIRIGEAEREFEDVEEGWINQQVNRRQADGLEVCVEVFIEKKDIDLILSTPACGPRYGSSRSPNSTETRIIDLWNERGLNQKDFTGGNLVAFIKQLKRLLS